MKGHTPGPWCIGSPSILGLPITCTHGVEIAHVPHHNHFASSDQRDANANLIAAAPDLLEALENILEDNPGCMCANCEYGRDVVKRAKGETD